ncbi:MAG: hypothetical protein KBF28_02170 [Gemmatimonadales bacterium]|nr:hypothetical protein [Gemmatimonadales bacterium]
MFAGISSYTRALLGNQPLFSLDAGGAHLRVVRFFGQEGISSLSGFRLELAGPEIDVGALVDKPAYLRIEGVETPRFVHGILADHPGGQTFDLVGHSRSGLDTTHRIFHVSHAGKSIADQRPVGGAKDEIV